MDYKMVYETHKKSSSLKKAQKILKKKLKLEKRQQNTQHFPNLKLQSSSTQKTNNNHKISKEKILNRCKSQSQYSSFSKHNYRIANLEYFNRNMKSKTQHYQRILSLDKRINTPPIVVDIAYLALRNSTTQSGTESVRHSAIQRLKTEQSRPQRHTVRPYMNTSRIFQPNINSKLRLSTLFHENSQQKQPKTPVKSPPNKQQKVQNIYLRKELSKKSMFTKMIEKNYTSHLPLIKQKKIHLR